jgi:hypothetical protein
MTIFFIIGLFGLVVWGVYVCIPNRGVGGIFASGIIVGAFLALVYLVKLVVMS